MEKKKFAIQKLFFTQKKMEICKGTGFPKLDTSSRFISKYNTKATPATAGVNRMTLSYKIAEGMVDTRENDYNVFVCEQDGKEFFLLTMGTGSVDSFNYFILDFNDDTYYSVNMWSHLLFTGATAIVRYLYPKDEFDKNFRKLNLDVDIIDTDQQKEFYIAADSMYFKFAEKIGNKNFDNKADEEIFKDAVQYIVADITGYAQKDYGETKLSSSAKNLGIKKKGIKLKKPIEIEVPLTTAQRVEKIKKETFSVFTKEEIENMPPLLRNGYELAKASFEVNKDFFDNKNWELISEIYNQEVKSLSFIGPAGVGKTTEIRAMAGALGMPFVLVGGSEGIEESHLLGTREVVVEDGASKTIWVDGPITTAIRYGGFLLFDEVNAAEPGVIMKLNTILDGSKAMILPTGEEVQVHPKFVYAEAMNVGSAYTGTNQMNMSHLDRIDQIFKIGQKSVDDEAKIIAACTGYDNMENLKKVCRIKKEIMIAIDDDGDESEQICSPRRLITWVKKAKRTGEFIESSLNTVISHLAVYDPSINELTKESVLAAEGVAAQIFNLICKEFEEVTY